MVLPCGAVGRPDAGGQTRLSQSCGRVFDFAEHDWSRCCGKPARMWTCEITFFAMRLGDSNFGAGNASRLPPAGAVSVRQLRDNRAAAFMVGCLAATWQLREYVLRQRSWWRMRI